MSRYEIGDKTSEGAETAAEAAAQAIRIMIYGGKDK